MLVVLSVHVGVFFTDLIFTKGKDPEKSAKKAQQTLGTYIAKCLLPGFGGVIGGTIGACRLEEKLFVMNYLDVLMTNINVVLDYKFTRDYLTPTRKWLSLLGKFGW